MYAMAALAGIGVGTAYLLPWTMLPDVVDADELKSGTRREGMFYAFFVFFQKISSGIALGLSTWALSIADYDSDLDTQPESVG